MPPLSSDGTDGPTPSARAGHTAIDLTDGAHKNKIVMFGGSSDANTQEALDENGRVWIFDPETLHWSHLDPADIAGQRPEARSGHAMVAAPGNSVIIHGGHQSKASTSLTDTWRFDLTNRVWTPLPTLSSSESAAPTSFKPPSLAIANETLYLLTNAIDNLSMTLHTFDLAAVSQIQSQQMDAANDLTSTSWHTVSIPTNPLTSSPSLTNGATFLPISTGLGRIYLLHIMGSTPSKDSSEPIYHSDIHALQLPSSSPTPAAVKDAVREAIPRADSHQLEWHVVTIVAKEEGSHPESWLETFETHQANVRTTVMNAAGAAGEWVKGRARAISNAAKDLHVGGIDEPESPSASKPPILEDKETQEPSSQQDPEQKKQDEKDDLPLSSEVPHPIKPGTEADAMSGLTSGKAHPGPRAWFGAAVLGEPTVGTIGSGEKPVRVVLWGGVNAKGEREADGWVIELRV